MTEREWSESDDPRAMLTWLDQYTISPTVWEEVINTKLVQLWVTYSWEISQELGQQAEISAHMKTYPEGNPIDWVLTLMDQSPQLQGSWAADILRDMVGNPHHIHHSLWREEILVQKVRTRPKWLTSQVQDIARLAYIDKRGEVCGKCRGKRGHYAGRVKSTIFTVDPWVKCDRCEGRGHARGVHLDSLTLCAMADMMEEEGCEDQPLLDHLRSPSLHVKGCWVMELILAN